MKILVIAFCSIFQLTMSYSVIGQVGLRFGVLSSDGTLNYGYNRNVICPNETITVVINGDASGAPLLLENTSYNQVNCQYVCTNKDPIIPVITADGILSTVIDHLTCNQLSGNSIITVQLKPAHSTKLKVSWQASQYVGPITKACNGGDSVAASFYTAIYNDSFPIQVVQPYPPKLIPSNQALNIPTTAGIYDDGDWANYTGTQFKGGMQWYLKDCNGYSLINTQPFYFPNSTGALSLYPYANKLGKMYIKAKYIFLPNCLSDFSDEAIVTVKPCRLFSGGGRYSTEIENIESNSCDINNQSRSDYHFYNVETELCGNNCDINAIWNWYKSKTYHQAIVLSDQMLFLRRKLGNTANVGFSRQLFPDEDYDAPITTNPTPIKLPRISTFGLRLGLSLPLVQNFVAPFGLLQYLCSSKPTNFSDPIFMKVDESSKCVVNYTLPDHILYPGKVTRCLVEECGKVKVLTFGEGTTNFPNNNVCGPLLSFFNQHWGADMFRNVDERLKSDYDSWQHRNSTSQISQTTTTSFINNPTLANTDWEVKLFRVQYPGRNIADTVYTYTDTINFYDLRNIHVYMTDSGKLIGTTVKGDISEGLWSYDSISHRLLTDTTWVDLVSQSTNEFTIKGNVPVVVDTSFQSLPYYMTFYKKSFVSKTYTFIGNGNWSDSAMWLDHKVPPAFIPYGTTVYIDPANTNSECNVDEQVVINKGAKVIVKTNGKLNVNGNMKLL